ncbi:uncharacterized protein C8Q71DRAFT_881873 [Rhodofomes roseus]|uniref:Uncharacterized protein n=1 Tax=Rhodofomes roseus TaxID=34475 RepID=A0ABQ8K598_9APHY|nr:uncharacterized protein C8Q71DRAFT_881873 [Rhodofomes roseus]KAH9831672.1 hypothetical protein C8Q71DRAFT_881873 [Rhodofomes roseus]
MEGMTTLTYIETVSSVLRWETKLVYRRLLKSDAPMPPPDEYYRPSTLSASMVSECAYAASIIAHACNSSVTVDMDAVRYSQRLNRLSDRVSDTDLQLRDFGHDADYAIELDLPSVVVDKFGVMLVWYLPDVLTPWRQRQMQDGLLTNSPLSVESKKKASWRRLETNFREGCEQALPNGTPTFAPAWYAVGSKIGREPPTT